MDILFKKEDFVFSYRVGGILIRNGKILLQRPKNDDYAIIGGHVAAVSSNLYVLSGSSDGGQYPIGRCFPWI